ncbi:MAG: methyltransferase, partial [Rhodocyclaceae bacterium]|nr:methyltransferase [Rhodocyclaceae bacterium]
VDDFIKDVVAARAQTTAFELRLIDTLETNPSATFEILKQFMPSTHEGLKLLLKLLTDSSVLENNNGAYCLTLKFIAALKYRDLLLAKLDFAHIAAHDFIDSFSFLIANPIEFMKRSGMFRLFNYGNAIESTPENRRQTERWMRITTMLTRYEAHACFYLHSFSEYRRMLDVGGNSGEFSLQACRVNPRLRATVFDLPVVCDAGTDHLRKYTEFERINFIKGNARTDELPEGFDLIVFKSMLHDWPEEDVRIFLNKACKALDSGGSLLIFERGPFEVGATGLSYSNIPILLFAHTLRFPDFYLKCLAENGLQHVRVQWIDLEMPFFLITGDKA